MGRGGEAGGGLRSRVNQLIISNAIRVKKIKKKFFL